MIGYKTGMMAMTPVEEGIVHAGAGELEFESNVVGNAVRIVLFFEVFCRNEPQL